MNTSQNSSVPGKTEVHGRGTGTISRDDIEQRAREIAKIKGRSEEEIFSDDREQARPELLGESLPDTQLEDSNSIGSLSRDPSNPVGIPGREIPADEGVDEKNELEKTVLDGVEEAQHDLMLEARKRRER